ncbi:hypothetical protein ACPA54_02155 [Uniformispora flossi]|uniref:hypothetical protein n=1 Tax=Uniformispora flossi TaxID=3390723 RepID=UPI003C309505
MQSFRVLAAKCEIALETPDAFRRPTESTPYFAAKSYSIYAFPFLHTRLILDLSEDSRRDLLAALRDVAAMLESGSVVDVRNRVVHAAEKFPGDAEIASACAMIERAVDILADRGLLPSVYAWAGDSMDSSRCRVTYMADGTGRTVELVSPSELDLCGLPQYSRPQLIMTAGRLKRTGEPVRFSYEEETGITEVWEDFLVRASEGKGIHDLAQPEPEASESHA